MNIEQIVIFSRSIPLHRVGGMEIITWDLAKKFKEFGLKVSCITTNIQGYKSSFIKDGIEVITINSYKSGEYSQRWFKETANYFIKNFNKDRVVVLSVSAGAKGLIDINVCNIPIVFQAHGTSIGEVKSKLRVRKLKPVLSSIKNIVWIFKDIKLYKKVDSIVAVGDRVYKDLTQFPYSYILNKDKIKQIHNGVDTNLFKSNLKERDALREEYNIQKDTKVVISVNRLHKQKGTHLALRGFAEYFKSNSNSIYLIVGDGPEDKELKRVAKDLKVADRVLFLGKRDREDIAKYLNIADVFLFTTLREEGLPLNALEALAVGLKVVISSHIKGIININSDHILPVNPNSINDIARALNVEVKESRVSYLPKEYSLDFCTKSYIELFNNLLKKRGNV